jgi:hypothetical protein
VLTKLALALLGLALVIPASAPGKGYARVVLISSDGRSLEVRGSERQIDGLLSRRGSPEPIRSGYVRLFFVGAGDFPANAGRYYPEQRCVALDWPRYERSCQAIDPAIARLLRPSAALERFRSRPTVLERISYDAKHSKLLTILRGPVELALDRNGRAMPKPSACYLLTGSWQGPRAAVRPRQFLLCPRGVYANGRLHPLGRGVWAWFRLNVDP